MLNFLLFCDLKFVYENKTAKIFGHGGTYALIFLNVGNLNFCDFFNVKVINEEC